MVVLPPGERMEYGSEDFLGTIAEAAMKDVINAVT
jgi:hypothetical protein